MDMSGRPTCCCPVCELEHALLTELNDANSETKYKVFVSQSSDLSAFPTCSDLLAHLRQSQTAGNHTSESDDILGELLRVSHKPQHEIGRHLLLLILMPAIHKASSQIAFGFPSLTRDDIAQHLLTCVLDIVSSQALCTQTSHFAFTITRSMRRSAFRWAIRESDLSVPAGMQEGTLNELSTDPNSSFEPKLLLGDFLSRCLSSGLLTPPEHELLLLFKIQGVSSEVLAARQQLSDVAFRRRMQRVIEKLRRVARAPSASSQPPDAAVA
jgi:DNA-directed RNA polymerase specialized sigma24 family protein